jgi:hypothetical protein
MVEGDSMDALLLLLLLLFVAAELAVTLVAVPIGLVKTMGVDVDVVPFELVKSINVVLSLLLLFMDTMWDCWPPAVALLVASWRDDVKSAKSHSVLAWLSRISLLESSEDDEEMDVSMSMSESFDLFVAVDEALVFIF